jgi:hypothetical protein
MRHFGGLALMDKLFNCFVKYQKQKVNGFTSDNFIKHCKKLRKNRRK